MLLYLPGMPGKQEGMSKQVVYLEVREKTMCQYCNGTGIIVSDQNPEFEYICQDCNGRGYNMNKRTIDLETLKGMLDGK